MKTPTFQNCVGPCGKHLTHSEHPIHPASLPSCSRAQLLGFLTALWGGGLEAAPPSSLLLWECRVLTVHGGQHPGMDGHNCQESFCCETILAFSPSLPNFGPSFSWGTPSPLWGKYYHLLLLKREASPPLPASLASLCLLASWNSPCPTTQTHGC